MTVVLPYFNLLGGAKPANIFVDHVHKASTFGAATFTFTDVPAGMAVICLGQGSTNSLGTVTIGGNSTTLLSSGTAAGVRQQVHTRNDFSGGPSINVTTTASSVRLTCVLLVFRGLADVETALGGDTGTGSDTTVSLSAAAAGKLGLASFYGAGSTVVITDGGADGFYQTGSLGSASLGVGWEFNVVNPYASQGTNTRFAYSGVFD